MTRHSQPQDNRDLRNPNVEVEPLYNPPKCEGSNHLTPSEYGRDQSAGIKHMNCQSCGDNWDEAI